MSRGVQGRAHLKGGKQVIQDLIPGRQVLENMEENRKIYIFIQRNTWRPTAILIGI